MQLKTHSEHALELSLFSLPLSLSLSFSLSFARFVTDCDVRCC